VTPYVGLSYFLLLLYPLGALVVLGLLGRLGRTAVLVVGVALVLFQYGRLPAGSGWSPLACLVAYAAASVALVRGYAVVRRARHGQLAFYAAVAAALVPLVVARLHPHAAGPDEAGLFDRFGFLGLSYMALRVVDVVVVLHDGVLREPPPAADLVSYLLFVPTISAGPIDRFRRFAADLDALPRPRRDYLRDVEAGIHRIAQGFLYKFVVAYLIQRHALGLLGSRSGVAADVEYMYAYSAYLFFDFAGYSAFAIGVGRFFGVRVPENFRAPFLSRSFREMWNRWHISLSWWLRDHVYMRFMLTAARRRWFGGSRRRAHAIGLVLTMGLMGCWHGLEPRYVVYGLYQGLMLVGYDAAARWNERHRVVADGRLAHAAGVLVTVNLFCFGLLIFSGRLFR
jgi:membrane protein involved in D-alanine export